MISFPGSSVSTGIHFKAFSALPESCNFIYNIVSPRTEMLRYTPRVVIIRSISHDAPSKDMFFVTSPVKNYT